MWIEEPKKTLVTALAAELLALFGSRAYARAERAVLA
jgi:hypothetical protein